MCQRRSCFALYIGYVMQSFLSWTKWFTSLFHTLAQCADVGHDFQHFANTRLSVPVWEPVMDARSASKALHGQHARLSEQELFHCGHTATFLDISVGYRGSVHSNRLLRTGPVFVRAWGIPMSDYTSQPHYPIPSAIEGKSGCTLHLTLLYVSAPCVIERNLGMIIRVGFRSRYF